MGIYVFNIVWKGESYVGNKELNLRLCEEGVEVIHSTLALNWDRA